MRLIPHIKAILKKLPIAFSKNQAYDLQTKKVIQQVCSSHSVCVDIGSFRGEILEWFCQFAPSGTHYAFEPIPEFAKQLKLKFKDQCIVHNVALGDTDGDSEFHFVKSNPSYSGLKRRRYDRKNETIEKITVKTSMLDGIIPDDIQIDLIKIDVEGAELLVLKGAKQTIQKNRPIIIFECGKGALDYYEHTPDEVYDFLADLGYSVSTMKNWLSKSKELSKSDFIDQFEHSINYYFITYPSEEK